MTDRTNYCQQNTVQKMTVQKHKQWSTKYYTENDWAKTQTMVNKILYRKWLSKNTNNGQQNTIQKMIEQKHKPH